MTVLKGHFSLNRDTKILAEAGQANILHIAEMLRLQLAAAGFSLPIQESNAAKVEANTILLTTQKAKKALGESGYALRVSRHGITLRSTTARGLFYAVQTLRQLLPLAVDQQISEVPAVEIEDCPRFPWRGVMLDCGRHFMDTAFIKRYIDLMAYHKMNVLHWHLTEDQGWRIEIKQYPKLTEIGAWRRYDDGSIYGGFYTQTDIKEIIDYAQQHYVTVVPEIELPGHSLAALAAYPRLSCSGGPFEVETEWGIHKEVYCAGNEETFAFLEAVLSEVIALFPSEYIHIGGDECLKDRWKNCPKCQARISAEGLKDEDELQSWFIRRIEKFLRSKGRRLIGWDEILEGGLAADATIQSWRGMEGAISAASAGHDAIVSPTSHTYFDYDVKITDLRKAYSFDPIPPELSAAQIKHILGGECCMWSERAPQPFIDRRMFPRMLAIAEALWSTAEGKDFTDFQQRVEKHYPRLSMMDVDYGPASRPVLATPVLDLHNGTCQVSIEANGAELSLHYTLDGSQPDLHAARYQSPVNIEKTTLLQVAGFKNERQYGKTIRQKFFIRKTSNGDSSKGRNHYLAENQHPIRGTEHFSGAIWQSCAQDDLETIIDLGEVKPIRQISSTYLQDIHACIFLPLTVEYSVSNAGVAYEILWAKGHNVSQNNAEALIRSFSYYPENLRGRYIKMRAVNPGCCPKWHPGAGSSAWVFADEMIVA